MRPQRFMTFVGPLPCDSCSAHLLRPMRYLTYLNHADGVQYSFTNCCYSLEAIDFSPQRAYPLAHEQSKPVDKGWTYDAQSDPGI